MFTRAPSIVVYATNVDFFWSVNIDSKKPLLAINTTDISKNGTYFQASKNLFAYKNFANGISKTISIEHDIHIAT